jgi:hypothetical protein
LLCWALPYWVLVPWLDGVPAAANEHHCLLADSEVTYI